MAEIGKQAKVPAKAKAAATTTRKSTAGKTSAVSDKVMAITPTHAEIAHLAETDWAERGRKDGYAEQDWLRAERELLKIAS